MSVSDAIERRREAQRLVTDYQRTFGTDHGRRVLDDLCRTFGMQRRVFVPVGKGNHHAYDPLAAALADGARAVPIHIMEQLAKPSIGDGNLESPQCEVKK